MSGTGQPPVPPPTPGPQQAFIDHLWKDIWRVESEGGVFEPIVALAETSLANFAANLPPGNPQAEQDLKLAENTHLFQSRHFAARLAGLETYRQQIQDISHQVYDQMAKFNEHAVKSLTLAHGGIVIAALAYVQARDTVPLGMIEVIGLCSFGYLLTLLGSHLVVALSAPMTNLLMTLRTPRIAEKVRAESSVSLQKAGRKMMWISRPVFYLSVFCLIAALFIGVRSLVTERRDIPRSPASKTYLLDLSKASG